jgi:hypothetical protein
MVLIGSNSGGGGDTVVGGACSTGGGDAGSLASALPDIPGGKWNPTLVACNEGLALHYKKFEIYESMQGRKGKPKKG